MKLFIAMTLSALLCSSSLFAKEKVTLQLKWFHQFQFAGYYMALEKGFYKDVGLDVVIKERDISKNNIKQVIDGEAQYGIADSVLLLYMAKEQPIVIVAPIFQHSANVLISLKSSHITSPYDFRDKKMLFYKNDSDAFGILAMLKSLHVEPSMIRSHNKKDDYLKLINKNIDILPAYITNEPYYFYKKHIKINLIIPANYGLDLYGDILFTSKSEALEHPDRVKRFKKATLKGWKYALTHKQEAIEIVHKKYAKDKSIEHLKFEADALEQIIQNKIIPLGTFDKGRLTYNMELYKKYGLIDKTVPVDKYIFEPKTNKNLMIFDDSEMGYLRDKGKLSLCIDPKWMPFEALIDGKYEGISSEYFKIFQKYLPIKIELHKTKTWEESLEALKSRKCDLVSLITATKGRKKYLNFTKTYIKAPIVIATKSQELFIDNLNEIGKKKIGVVKDYSVAEFIRKSYPNITVIDVDSVEDGLKRVADGELYGMVDTVPTLGYIIQNNYIGTLKIAGKVVDKKYEFKIGVRNDEPILKGIFNKLINQVDKSRKQEIYNRWVSVIYEKKADYMMPFRWLVGFTVLLGFVIYTYASSNKKLKHEIQKRKTIEKKLKQLSITDDLTSLYNRRYFNKAITRVLYSAVRDGKTLAFCIMDLDFFKQYNDTYGHIAGDELLKKLSAILKESFSRADDYIFRLGGEEFGILFKGVSKENAFKLVDKLRSKIENLKLEHKNSRVLPYVSASFGLIVRDAKEFKDEKEIYRLADELLYRAKYNGRNRVEMI